MYKELRLYGEENFSVNVLENNLPEELKEIKERYYIQKYKTYYLNNYGYNMTIGGNGTIGYVFTEEDKNKISAAGKGRKFSKERNEKIRNVMIGREYKDEWKQNLSKARKGKFTGEKNPFYGKHHTEESKRKISEANTGRKMSDEFKNLQREIHLGVKFTEEHKLKLSENNKASKKVIQLDLYNNFIKEFKSMKAAERETGIKAYNISSCCRGIQKTAGGYIWKYKESVSTNCRMEDELPFEAPDNQ